MAGSIVIGKGGVSFKGNQNAQNKQQPYQPSFGGKKQPAPADDYIIKEDVNSVNRRVKMLEERYTNLRSKSQITEQNMLQKNKTFFTEIRALNLELIEVKKEINELKDKMVLLIKELESFAKKENVDILKKYIDLWAPVNFTTKNEVEDIVREVIDKMRRE